MNSTLNGKLHNVNIDLIFKNKCSNVNSFYYVLNLGSKTLIKVDKDRFKSTDAPVITFKHYKIKYKGIEKQLALNILKNYFVNFDKNKYSPESFEGEGLLDYILKVKQLVSSLSNVPSAISDVFASVITQVLYLKDLGSNLWNKLFLMELVQLFASLFSLMEPRLTTFKSNVLDIGDILLKIYKLFLYVKEGIRFGAESIGDLLSLGAACILPAPLMELFRKASTLSSMKIMDDASIFFELFDTILNFIKVILESLPVSVSSFLNPFLEKLTIKGRFVMLHKAKSLLKTYRKNKLQIAESRIREEWKKEVDEILSDTGLLEWKRYSNLVAVILSDIGELKKNIDVYDKSSRQEPTCFIFEGHAGCMKSCSLNAVVQVLNKSSYSHLSKGLMDGKNWYDRYNNEYIFYQDDMGQQGISQWRNLMNYVSPVKMPLDCADSKLKDTKFFNSNILLFSTNNFMNIQGLTRGDGIESLEALHRRGMVFDFYGVQRSFGAIAGVVKFQYFDTQDHKKFINKFPPEFEKYIKDNNVLISPFFNCDGNNYHQLIAWMCTIIENFDSMKQEIYKNSEMSVETLKDIRNMILKPKKEEVFVDAPEENFEPESLEEFYNSFKEVVNYCVSEAIEGLNSLKSIMAANPQLYITTVVVLLSIWSKAYFQKFEPEAGEVLENIIKTSKLTVESTAAQFISRQTYFCNLHFNKSNMESCCLVSGHFVLLNSHAVKEEQGFITIYQHHSKNHRLLDHVPFSVYFRSNNDDVCIISIPDKIHSPFKKLDHLLNAAGFNASSVHLCTPVGPIRLLDHLLLHDNSSFQYKLGNFTGTIEGNKDAFYDFRSTGMCGSILYDTHNGMVGSHVAGDENNNIGVARVWSKSTIYIIKSIFANDSFILDEEISPKVIEDFSGIKLQANKHLQSQKLSDFVPSPLYGWTPPGREPADLQKYGPHTVKDVGKKSFKPIVDVDFDELDFAKEVLESAIEEFDDISYEEVINGKEGLASLNKKSSNGFGFPGDKNLYIDFEKSTFKPQFQEELLNFINNIEQGTVKMEDNLWCETLKDEVRDFRKDRVPRTFRVSNLMIQVLTKKCTANLAINIGKNKWFNQIMIGVNPYKDWQRIHDTLSQYRYIWDGDIGNYDGNMVPQVQFAVSDILLKKYTGKHRLVLDYLLQNQICTTVGMNDDVYLTTHSFPSGSFLTALFNSLVNKAYTAMWYYRNIHKIKKPSVKDFWTEIVDFVYGDDKLNAVTNNPEVLNALTMRDFFESLGMTYTDAHKKSVSEPFSNIHEVSFLKRDFKYHSKIKQIVGPLSLTTIDNSIMWLNSKKDGRIVLKDKLNAYQREIYLHENSIRDERLGRLKQFVKDNKLEEFFTELPEHYLLSLYLKEDYGFSYSSQYV